MAEKTLQLIESLQTADASVARLFGGEGQRVRDQRYDPMDLVAAAELLERAEHSRRAMSALQEAMSTSDFPLLFADIMDRELLGYYSEVPTTWTSYVRSSTVRDFRKAKRYAVDGAEGALDEVKELAEYPEGKLDEAFDTFDVGKFGRRLSLSWEAEINDDFDSFRRNPERLARAARRTEARFAARLWLDEKGPHASLYKEAFNNIIKDSEGKQPVLSIAALQLAYTLLSKMKDNDGEPILMEAMTLVVPPALEVTAMNILNAVHIWTTEQGGTEKQKLEAVNWMSNRLTLQVEPYIPYVATKENGDTSWALFANPNSGRAALELGKLRGYEEPSLYEKAPDARRVGGGDVNESFDNDSMSWRVRHVLGGTRMTETGGQKATVASNGSGK